MIQLYSYVHAQLTYCNGSGGTIQDCSAELVLQELQYLYIRQLWLQVQAKITKKFNQDYGNTVVTKLEWLIHDFDSNY